MISEGRSAEHMTPARSRHLVPLRRGLEQFDRVSVGILHLDLPATRPCHHRIPEAQASLLQLVDPRRKIADTEDDTVPSAWPLDTPIGHRTRARCTVEPRPPGLQTAVE